MCTVHTKIWKQKKNTQYCHNRQNFNWVWHKFWFAYYISCGSFPHIHLEILSYTKLLCWGGIIIRKQKKWDNVFNWGDGGGTLGQNQGAQYLTWIQGVQKKMRRSFCLISLDTSILEGWDIMHWKVGIHGFIWSTKTFLYDIREPRYKQIKMGYQISKCLHIGQS